MGPIENLVLLGPTEQIVPLFSNAQPEDNLIQFWGNEVIPEIYTKDKRIPIALWYNCYY